MTDEQKKRFEDCIKVIPSKNHETPESADKSALEAYKAEQKAKMDQEDADLTIHNDLQRIGKELQAINRELNALNKNLRRR
jgi:hypothetical protein